MTTFKLDNMFEFSVGLLALEILSTYTVYTTHSGCSASPILDDRPFVVVWNHPTRLCEAKGINLNLKQWGILDNEQDRFFGQEIVLFYHLGKWPYYLNNLPNNGGLPQLADVPGHTAKVESDLKTSVWNKSFSGLGVIDMEYWRPLFQLNFDSKKIYKVKSIELVKQKFPAYNTTQVLAEAIQWFEATARNLMGKTMDQVTSGRPSGRWGYYGFPRCWDKYCNTSTTDLNDRMSWIYSKSTGIYPSIYFTLTVPTPGRQKFINETLKEAFRVKAKYAPQDAPVLPYAQCQSGPYNLFKNADLSSAILQPADMGASGVVLWGSSSDAMAKNECSILQSYINNTLGPYVRNVYNFFGNCSQQLCTGHGRCVRKDYEKVYQHHLREAGRKECQISDYELWTPNLESTRDSKDAEFRNISKQTEKLNVRETLYKREKLFNEFHKTGRVVPFKENDTNGMWTFDLGLPQYDFDDYVCKCFGGWSGKRCDQNV